MSDPSQSPSTVPRLLRDVAPSSAARPKQKTSTLATVPCVSVVVVVVVVVA